ncbi:hypothetical protein BLNAU_12745 [Blattamonas nauphoetae]|uniref:Protein kinase domain-containing protein n=1 Tax=Blattamonas nauphoetae TaxID=2049346 RepID=A0ABQ9XMA5_9EUKA|nr:hypothetical protein BLNAU_12745 [Blattamonas nauphoetae]
MFAPKIRESPEEALASLNIQIVKSLGHGQYGKLSLYFLFIMYSVYLVMFHGNQYAAKVIPTMKLTGGDEQIVKLAQDIKAENIMLHYSQDFGKVIPKIADFGLMREGSNAQMAMTQCGTPLYMV